MEALTEVTPFEPAAELRRRKLDRNVAVKLGIGRAVHLAHAAGPKLAMIR